MLKSLTRSKVIPDFLVSLSERIEDPPASGKESLMSKIVVIGQRPEAVDP
jgi:hypothetical protein